MQAKAASVKSSKAHGVAKRQRAAGIQRANGFVSMARFKVHLLMQGAHLGRGEAGLRAKPSNGAERPHLTVKFSSAASDGCCQDQALKRRVPPELHRLVCSLSQF